jgi:capsular polysaccharide biosynthesis protein
MSSNVHIRRNSLVAPVLAAALIGGVLGALFVSQQSDRFSAETVIAIGAAQTIIDDDQLIDIVGTLERSGVPATVAGLASSRSVFDAAVVGIGLPPDEASDYDVTATPVIDANLVDIATTGPDAAIAASLTNAIAEQTQLQFAQLYRVFELRIVTLADAPSASDRPSASLVIVGAAVLAALIALLLLSWRSEQGLRGTEPVLREQP